MRVLMVDQFGEPGGAQLCLLDSIRALREAGWDVDVAAPAEGPLGEACRARGASF
jgi:hypothetical protein